MIQIQILINDGSPAPLHAEALGSSAKILIVETIIIIWPPASTRPAIVCNNWWLVLCLFIILIRLDELGLRSQSSQRIGREISCLHQGLGLQGLAPKDKALKD